MLYKFCVCCRPCEVLDWGAFNTVCALDFRFLKVLFVLELVNYVVTLGVFKTICAFCVF